MKLNLEKSSEIFKMKGKLILSLEKKNIINFLVKGLSLNYLPSNYKDIHEIFLIMKKFNEDLTYINLINTYLFKCQLKKKICSQRSFSTTSIRNFSYDLFEKEFMSISPRPTNRIYDIFEMKSIDFVLEITRQYTDLIKNINCHELIKFCSKGLKSINITTITNEFTKLSYFVPTEILIKRKNKKQRIKVIKKFIEIGNCFLELNNFHALFAIVGGLNNANVQRIKNLWDPKRKYVKDFLSLEKYASCNKGFSYYRSHLKTKENDKKIPFIGVILADIVHLLEKTIDLETCYLNKDNYQTLVNLLNTFECCQKHDIIKNNKICIFFENLNVTSDDEMLYEISCKIYEPKNKVNKTSKVNHSSDKIEKIEIIKHKIANAKLNMSKKNIGSIIKLDSIKQKFHPSNNKIPIIKKTVPNYSKDAENFENNSIEINMMFIEEKFIEEWNNDEVLIWLTHIGKGEYVKIFKRHDITGFSLVELNDEYMQKYLQITKLGHRLVLLKNIELYKKK